jgi:uncharacterized protein YndB with AHSA1/START domain
MKLTVKTVINSNLTKVFDLWNQPEAVMEWCHAGPDWHVPAATVDLQVGGKFVTTMAAKDGSAQFDWVGKYTKIVPNQEINYVMEDGREAQVLFEETTEGILVIENFDPEDIHSHELQIDGWQAILNNFKQYVETN